MRDVNCASFCCFAVQLLSFGFCFALVVFVSRCIFVLVSWCVCCWMDYGVLFVLVECSCCYCSVSCGCLRNVGPFYYSLSVVVCVAYVVSVLFNFECPFFRTFCVLFAVW